MQQSLRVGLVASLAAPLGVSSIRQVRLAAGVLVLAFWLGGCATTVVAPTMSLATEAATIQLRVTVSDGGCSLEPEGKSSVAAGPVVLVTANQTDARASADLWRMREGHSFEELAAHIDAERVDAEAGGPGLGHPFYVTGLISSGIVEPGSSTTVEGILRPGAHGIVCLRHFDAVTTDPFRPFTTIGPIDAG